MMARLRAWSLWQPWATLVARQLKLWETRGRPVHYRGAVAIHAARNQTAMPSLVHLLSEAGIPQRLRELPPIALWPAGGIVALTTIVDCRPADRVALGLERQELAFGNYAVGRWAIRLADTRELRQPVPCRGYQGFWNLPPEIAESVRQAIPRP